MKLNKRGICFVGTCWRAADTSCEHRAACTRTMTQQSDTLTRVLPRDVKAQVTGDVRKRGRANIPMENISGRAGF